MSCLLRFEATSDIGCVRTNNEDMAYVAGEFLRDRSLSGDVSEDVRVGFAVADGMGGYEGGEIASEIACRSFASFMKSLQTDDATIGVNLIKQWVLEANRLVYESTALRPELSEMGTTFIGMIVDKSKMWLINIGDSRCYRFRDGVLKQLSTDHSERERTGNPDIPGNLIYNFLGNYPRDFFSDVSVYALMAGDSYLLCSDGLSDLVSEELIEENIFETGKLLQLAKEAGGRDNITLITIQIDEPIKA